MPQFVCQRNTARTFSKPAHHYSNCLIASNKFTVNKGDRICTVCSRASIDQGTCNDTANILLIQPNIIANRQFLCRIPKKLLKHRSLLRALHDHHQTTQPRDSQSCNSSPRTPSTTTTPPTDPHVCGTVRRACSWLSKT